MLRVLYDRARHELEHGSLIDIAASCAMVILCTAFLVFVIGAMVAALYMIRGGA